MVDSKASGDRIASRPMFEESERLHPVREEERIKVENIKGKLIFVGAEALLYAHGTHFVFPQSMLKAMLPAGSGLLVRLMFKAGRQCPKECKQARLDINRKLSQAVAEWGGRVRS